MSLCTNSVYTVMEKRDRSKSKTKDADFDLPMEERLVIVRMEQGKSRTW